AFLPLASVKSPNSSANSRTRAISCSLSYMGLALWWLRRSFDNRRRRQGQGVREVPNGKSKCQRGENSKFQAPNSKQRRRTKRIEGSKRAMLRFGASGFTIRLSLA